MFIMFIYICIFIQFREEVKRLQKENEELKQQIDDRDNAIAELVECYNVRLYHAFIHNIYYFFIIQYCQLHHLNKGQNDEENNNNSEINKDNINNETDNEVLNESPVIKKKI